MSQPLKKMQVVQVDKVTRKTKIVVDDTKTIAELIDRKSAAEYNKRVIYNFPDATKTVDNPNSLANIFKRIIGKK